MHNKRLKLKVQNAALLEDGQGGPQIFKNLRIYVSLSSPSGHLIRSALIALSSRPPSGQRLHRIDHPPRTHRTSRSARRRIRSVPRQEEPRHAHHRDQPDADEAARVRQIQSGDARLARQIGRTRPCARLAGILASRSVKARCEYEQYSRRYPRGRGCGTTRDADGTTQSLQHGRRQTRIGCASRGLPQKTGLSPSRREIRIQERRDSRIAGGARREIGSRRLESPKLRPAAVLLRADKHCAFSAAAFVIVNT